MLLILGRTEQLSKAGKMRKHFNSQVGKGYPVTGRDIAILLPEDATVIHLLEDFVSTAVNSRQIRN